MSKRIVELIHMIEKIRCHGQEYGDPKAVLCCENTIKSLKEFNKTCKNFHKECK